MLEVFTKKAIIASELCIKMHVSENEERQNLFLPAAGETEASKQRSFEKRFPKLFSLAKKARIMAMSIYRFLREGVKNVARLAERWLNEITNLWLPNGDQGPRKEAA